MAPVRHLAPELDAHMVRFCAVLIGLDVFFIGVSSIHRVYASILEGQPFLGSAWDIRHDYSYAEIFGYFKLALLIVAMLSTSQIRRRPII